MEVWFLFFAPQSAFRDDRIGRSRKVIPQGYGLPGGYPPNRGGEKGTYGFPGNIKKPQKPPKWHYLIPVYIGILRILGFSKNNSLNIPPKSAPKICSNFLGYFDPPRGGVVFGGFLCQNR